MAEQIFEKAVLATTVERYTFDFGESRSEAVYSHYMVTFKSMDQSKINSRIKNGDRQTIHWSEKDTFKTYSTYESLPVGYDWKLKRKTWANKLEVIITAYYSIQALDEKEKDYLSKVLDKIRECEKNLDPREEEYINRFKLGLYRLPVEVNLDKIEI